MTIPWIVLCFFSIALLGGVLCFVSIALLCGVLSGYIKTKNYCFTTTLNKLLVIVVISGVNVGGLGYNYGENIYNYFRTYVKLNIPFFNSRGRVCSSCLLVS